MNAELINQLTESRINHTTLTFFLGGIIISGLLFLLLVAENRMSCGKQEAEASGVSSMFGMLLALVLLSSGIGYGAAKENAARAPRWARAVVSALQNHETSTSVGTACGTGEFESLTLRVPAQTHEESVVVLGKPIKTTVTDQGVFETKLNIQQIAILEKAHVQLAENIAKQLGDFARR